MTPSLAALKELALKAKSHLKWYSSEILQQDGLEIQNCDFIEAASPDVILSLIEKLEVAEARIKKLEYALEFYTQLPEMTVGNRVYKQLYLKALEALKEE